MSAPDAVKLIGQVAALLAKVPPSLLTSVVDVVKAIAAGDSSKAERLARNAALALAAKQAAAARIKAQKR